MAEVLSINTTLKVMHLTYNPIEIAGVLAISAALKINTTLSDVELLPVLNVCRDGSFVESEDLGQMMTIISMHLQRNKDFILSPKSSTLNSKLEMFIKNLDSAFAVSQVLGDIIKPVASIPRSTSLEEMVDVKYKK